MNRIVNQRAQKVVFGGEHAPRYMVFLSALRLFSQQQLDLHHLLRVQSQHLRSTFLRGRCLQEDNDKTCFNRKWMDVLACLSLR